MRPPQRFSPIWHAILVAAAFGMAPQDEPEAPAEAAPAEPAEAPAPHRVFPASKYVIDEILTRPYGPEVPFGAVGDRLWASSPQGWGFGADVQWVYLTNLRPLDVQVRDAHGPLRPASATYYPSHVHLEGAERTAVPSASFTFRTDSIDAPLSKPFEPENRWTCWSSGDREDWYAVDYGAPRTFSGIKLWFYDDSGTGGVRPPRSYSIERFEGDSWVPVPLGRTNPGRPGSRENTAEFTAPVTSSRFRVVMQHAGEDFYTGLYGFEPIEQGGPPPVELELSGDKFITPDDILVSEVRVRNPGAEPAVVEVVAVTGWEGLQEYQMLSNRRTVAEPDPETAELIEPEGPFGLWSLAGTWRTRLLDFDVRHDLRFAVTSDPPADQDVHETLKAILAESSGPEANASWMRSSLPVAYTIAPGETKRFRAALQIRKDDEPSTIERVVDAPTVVRRIRRREGSRLSVIRPSEQETRDVLAGQVAASQGWYDENVAFFDCSDPLVAKMYYHRAYNLRKNMFDPKLGRLAYPTQAEGRWRSTWYPNVISYGAGHQVREARWLRDPKYWRGHLQTWAENAKPDGVYPSHVTPAGPAGGQYTDWITSTAWDAHLVHPSAEFLTPLADALAANVRGWQATTDTDDDGLLAVDSHWWTGMEYQPSFFYFSDFKTSEDFYEPAEQVALERVDLTSYNYGNAVAMAKLDRALGRTEEASEFDALAEKIAGAVEAKMWRPEGEFFYSLRAEDDEVADVKEIVGVYPFYFGMLPTDKGYEAAWASVLDPEQFWTPWPVASASKQCPAYSQSGWPVADGRRSTCMWNGPTWPHANSIVLTAMARTLRADRDRPEGAEGAPSPLTKDKFWELFLSFTKAQYRDGNLDFPWTGEFYDGETGAWQTRERDYNHSTYLDLVIPEVVGIVPREDAVLEVDPMVPESALSYFVLDGQHYRGHDVTVAWDAADDFDAFEDGRDGLNVYLDGKLVASSPNLGRLLINLDTGEPISPPDAEEPATP